MVFETYFMKRLTLRTKAFDPETYGFNVDLKGQRLTELLLKHNEKLLVSKHEIETVYLRKLNKSSYCLVLIVSLKLLKNFLRDEWGQEWFLKVPCEKGLMEIRIFANYQMESCRYCHSYQHFKSVCKPKDQLCPKCGGKHGRSTVCKK